jgi:hypothetical protein
MSQERRSRANIDAFTRPVTVAKRNARCCLSQALRRRANDGRIKPVGTVRVLQGTPNDARLTL